MWLQSLAQQVSLYAATTLGAASSYLWLGLPKISHLRAVLTKLTGWRSQTRLSQLEFLIVLVLGTLVVHYLVKTQDPGMAFASGMSWYTLMGGRARQ